MRGWVDDSTIFAGRFSVDHFVHLYSQSWEATCTKFGKDMSTIGAPTHVLGLRYVTLFWN